jgi:hypothetical protein
MIPFPQDAPLQSESTHQTLLSSLFLIPLVMILPDNPHPAQLPLKLHPLHQNLNPLLMQN